MDKTDILRSLSHSVSATDRSKAANTLTSENLARILEAMNVAVSATEMEGLLRTIKDDRRKETRQANATPPSPVDTAVPASPTKNETTESPSQDDLIGNVSFEAPPVVLTTPLAVTVPSSVQEMGSPVLTRQHTQTPSPTTHVHDRLHAPLEIVIPQSPPQPQEKPQEKAITLPIPTSGEVKYQPNSMYEGTITPPRTPPPEAPWELPPITPQHPHSHQPNFVAPEEDLDVEGCLVQAPHFALFPRCVVCSFNALRRDYCPGEEIVGPGTEPTHVYVVLSGCVQVFVFAHGMHIRTGTVEASGTFGAENVILQRRHNFSFRAGDEQTLVALIPKDVFLKAVKENPPVSQSFARNLCEQMNLFRVFRRFCRDIFSTSTTTLDMPSILNSYSELESCLHPHLKSPKIDVDAWAYAINRLPANITETFSLTLSRNLPPFLAERMRRELSGQDGRSASSDTKLITTRYRRRCAWEIGSGSGKTLVLLRDGFTDMLDFVTMLCVHITESKKLRGRLQGMVAPAIADILDSTLKSKAYVDHYFTMKREPLPMQQGVVDKLPLSPEEKKGLLNLWPKELLRRLHDIIMHREEFLVGTTSGVSKRFDCDPYQQWMLNIRSHVLSAIGQNVNDQLPQDIGVHIISSNTYSTKHVLLPFIRVHSERILEYGRTYKPEIVKLAWKYPEDMLYCLFDSYVAQNNLSEEYNTCLADNGFYVMEDQAATGLAVDVICLWMLDKKKLDTILARAPAGVREPDLSKDIIINMDFAFGAQADGILRALILLFGHRIRSVNVLGKAGGLCGKRGDIQLPSHVLLSKSSLANSDATDELRSCDNRDIKVTRLEELSGRQVHCGPVLTIPGTVLQNVELLRYYSILWGCVGVEMEGSYFARQVSEAMHIGLVKSDLRMRFAYNTSDLPMQVSGESNLSTDLRPDELVPPLYAITRCFVEQILFGWGNQ